MAWTLGRVDKWIWPIRPQTSDPLATMDRFYEQRGWIRQVLPPPTGDVIALFCTNDASAGPAPQHVARKVADDWWESKLGRFHRIVHRLAEIECPTYGCVHSYYVPRPRAGKTGA